MKHATVIITVFILLPLLAVAQQTLMLKESKPVILGISFDYGFLIKHSESLREIDDAYPFAVRLDWSKHLLTQRAWNFCNCFPRVGMSLAYWNWDNPEVLGSGILPMAYLEPYFMTQRRTNLFFRMGLGGAFLTKPYDEVSNPQNLSYSTLFSFSVMVGTGLQYRLTDQINLRFAAKYNHISNGGVRIPNKGLNFPTLSLGINTSLDEFKYPKLTKVQDRQAPQDKTRLSLVYFSGWSNAQFSDKSTYFVLGMAGTASRWIDGRSALSVGTEWIMDYSRREEIELLNRNDVFQQGAFLVGHEFWLGKVTFSQHFGIYYFKPFRNSDDIYQRYTLTYYFTPNLFGGISLKSHRHVADFFDFRVGYRF
ncbi:MAG: acyloxyacyl hydrolase [Bacteroidota bacterium]